MSNFIYHNPLRQAQWSLLNCIRYRFDQFIEVFFTILDSFIFIITLGFIKTNFELKSMIRHSRKRRSKRNTLK